MKYQLLFVDDEKLFRSGVARLIAQAYPQFAVLEAENGERALQILRETRIDCMFLDIRMPKIDGIRLLELMEQMGLPKIPVVILSGYADFSYAKSALQHNAFDYLLKPITPDEAMVLAQRLLAHLEQRQQQAFQQRKLEALAREAAPLIRSQLLRDLLDGQIALPALREQAALLGLPLTGPWFCCGALELVPPPEPEMIRPVWRRLEQAGTCIVFEIHSRLTVLLFSAPQAESCGALPRQTMQSLVDSLRSMQLQIHCGLGPWLDQLHAVSRSYEQAVRQLSQESREPTVQKGHLVHLVQTYIQENYAKALSNAELADAMGYSANYLSQVFKAETGTGINEFIRSVRLQHAKMLLRHTGYKITDIAEMVGFSNNQYFTTLFRKMNGVTPKEYRENKSISE